MRGFALKQTAELAVLSAYAAPVQTIPAVATTPGWYVMGAFFLESSAELRLEVIGLVSDVDLTMRARLFDMTTNEPVGDISVSVRSLTDTRVLSGFAKLTGGRLYQIQVEVTGGAGEDQFGVLRSAAPTV
jgi:hypothetical protein